MCTADDPVFARPRNDFTEYHGDLWSNRSSAAHVCEHEMRSTCIFAAHPVDLRDELVHDLRIELARHSDANGALREMIGDSVGGLHDDQRNTGGNRPAAIA